LKQQTGIVNKKELKVDFETREVRKADLEARKKMLIQKHAQLSSVINQGDEIKRMKES